jgi:hypothetical protein
MHLKDTERKGEDQVHLAQDTIQWPVLVNTVIKLSGSIKGGEFD